VLAAEYRFESENGEVVTSRALEKATSILRATHGQLDVDALVCRFEALRIRENARFPIDPPARLGARLSRAQFQKLCGM